jgi:hypothetical protein
VTKKTSQHVLLRRGYKERKRERKREKGNKRGLGTQ